MFLIASQIAFMLLHTALKMVVATVLIVSNDFLAFCHICFKIPSMSTPASLNQLTILLQICLPISLTLSQFFHNRTPIAINAPMARITNPIGLVMNAIAPAKALASPVVITLIPFQINITAFHNPITVLISLIAPTTPRIPNANASMNSRLSLINPKQASSTPLNHSNAPATPSINACPTQDPIKSRMS